MCRTPSSGVFVSQDDKLGHQKSNGENGQHYVSEKELQIQNAITRFPRSK